MPSAWGRTGLCFPRNELCRMSTSISLSESQSSAQISDRLSTWEGRAGWPNSTRRYTDTLCELETVSVRSSVRYDLFWWGSQTKSRPHKTPSSIQYLYPPTERSGLEEIMGLAVLSVCVCLCTRIGGDMHSNERLLVPFFTLRRIVAKNITTYYVLHCGVLSQGRVFMSCLVCVERSKENRKL